jgi:hypothetical protein
MFRYYYYYYEHHHHHHYYYYKHHHHHHYYYEHHHHHHHHYYYYYYKLSERQLIWCLVYGLYDWRELGFDYRQGRYYLGPERDEVTGEWRRLHNKELYALYSSPNIIRRSS